MQHSSFVSVQMEAETAVKLYLKLRDMFVSVCVRVLV